MLVPIPVVVVSVRSLLRRWVLARTMDYLSRSYCQLRSPSFQARATVHDNSFGAPHPRCPKEIEEGETCTKNTQIIRETLRAGSRWTLREVDIHDALYEQLSIII